MVCTIYKKAISASVLRGPRALAISHSARTENLAKLLALAGSATMHLMYVLDEDGKRIYTLKVHFRPVPACRRCRRRLVRGEYYFHAKSEPS